MERQLSSIDRRALRVDLSRRCPRDFNRLSLQSIHGMALSRCDRCAGIWVPAPVVALAVSGIKKPSTGRMEGITCPEDGSLLMTVSHRKVSLDVCSQCGGVWLDAGELERVLKRQRAASNGSGFADAVPDLITDLPELCSLAGDLAGNGLEALVEFLAEALSGL